MAGGVLSQGMLLFEQGCESRDGIGPWPSRSCGCTRLRCVRGDACGGEGCRLGLRLWWYVRVLVSYTIVLCRDAHTKHGSCLTVSVERNGGVLWGFPDAESSDFIVLSSAHGNQFERVRCGSGAHSIALRHTPFRCFLPDRFSQCIL